MSIVTSLLHANYKENLMTRFSTKSTKAILKARLYLFRLPWQRRIRRRSYQKSEGSRALEKKENETQVSKLCSVTLTEFFEVLEISSATNILCNSVENMTA